MIQASPHWAIKLAGARTTTNTTTNKKCLVRFPHQDRVPPLHPSAKSNPLAMGQMKAWCPCTLLFQFLPSRSAGKVPQQSWKGRGAT